MNLEEYEKVKNFSYLEYCDYLQGKYGIGKCDYMTPNFIKNKNVTRTKEGLYAHHKMEYEGILLSNLVIAKAYPYEYQKAENIVYCDFLEHLLLHIMIYEFTGIFGKNGLRVYMIPELNDVYSGWNTTLAWQKNCHNKIKDDIDVYYNLINRYWLTLNNYGIYDDIEQICKSFNNRNEYNESLYQKLTDIVYSNHFCKNCGEWIGNHETLEVPNNLYSNEYKAIKKRKFCIEHEQ